MAHKEQRNFCERVKARFPDDFNKKKVLDVGSLDINGNNRYLFDNCDYTGIDLGPGKNVDIICSAHKFKGQYDTIISTEMFEHDPHIKDSLDNIVSNLLKPGGLFIFTCASEGRPEHGTAKHKSYDSPSTNDYYKNLSEKDIRELIDIDSFFGNNFKFAQNFQTKDLYFAGRKAPNNDLSFWEQPKVSIIIPVIRPKEARRCISAIKKNIGLPIDHYEIVSEMDTHEVGCPEMVKKLTEKAKYDLVMFLGDDTVPEPNFMRHALDMMESLPDSWGVVGLNTKGPVSTDFADNSPENSNPYAHWLAHKKMLEHIPGGAFFSIEYKHSYGDAELKEIAEDIGRWAFAEGARIDHIHPINQSAPDDEHYKRAYSEKNAIHDKKTYCNRKRTRMQKKYGTKLAIAMPLTDDKVYNQFFFSFIKVITEYMSSLIKKGKPISFDVLMPNFPCQVDAARNDLVNQALLLGCTHILMMDTDQIYATTDMIEKMLAHNKPVVGARVHRRYPPFDPLLLRGDIGELYQVPDSEVRNKDGNYNTELLVTYTGTGCILYEMQIFNDMIPDKWFEFKTGKVGQPIGEDIVFCAKLEKYKIPIVVDCSIDIKHLTLMATDWGTYKLFSKIMGGKKNGIRK